MSISIYDLTPATQTFVPFEDSQSIFQGLFNFCLEWKYELSTPITYVTAPATSLSIADLWTISAITPDKAYVKMHTVTLTASLISYPGVTAQSVTFNLTVIDNCETAKLTSENDSTSSIIFVPLINT